MNAYELADLIGLCGDGGYNQDAANMLRQQADYITQLEKGLESSIAMNKAQAERQVKELTDEEIKEVWMNRPANTANGVIDFARAILRKAQEK